MHVLRGQSPRRNGGSEELECAGLVSGKLGRLLEMVALIGIFRGRLA